MIEIGDQVKLKQDMGGVEYQAGLQIKKGALGEVVDIYERRTLGFFGFGEKTKKHYVVSFPVNNCLYIERIFTDQHIEAVGNSPTKSSEKI